MTQYGINYGRLALAIVPIKLRKPLLMALLNVLLTGVRRADSVFGQFRADTNFRLYHNGQVCYLRAALNDTFDWERRRITIDDTGDYRESVIIYRRDDPVHSVSVPVRNNGAIIINRRSMTIDGALDFTVSVPDDVRLTYGEAQIRALIDQFKLASKRYTLNFY